uniref:Uncharacterized protein n=1 Tax=Rhizophora mucronata TaxID=61149 RepID=A0A2P2QMM5_RHIMU
MVIVHKIACQTTDPV